MALFVALAIALGGMPPSHAADIGQLDCPLASLDSAERGALGVLAAQPDDRDLYRDLLRDRRTSILRCAVGLCAGRLGWTTREGEDAFRYHLAAAGLAELRRWMSANHYDVTELEGAILADRVLTGEAAADQLYGQAGRAFVRRHRTVLGRLLAGRPPEDPLGWRLGKFVAFRALLESSRSRFAPD